MLNRVMLHTAIPIMWRYGASLLRRWFLSISLKWANEIFSDRMWEGIEFQMTDPRTANVLRPTFLQQGANSNKLAEPPRVLPVDRMMLQTLGQSPLTILKIRVQSTNSMYRGRGKILQDTKMGPEGSTGGRKKIHLRALFWSLKRRVIRFA